MNDEILFKHALLISNSISYRRFVTNNESNKICLCVCVDAREKRNTKIYSALDGFCKFFCNSVDYSLKK